MEHLRNNQILSEVRIREIQELIEGDVNELRSVVPGVIGLPIVH